MCPLRSPRSYQILTSPEWRSAVHDLVPRVAPGTYKVMLVPAPPFALRGPASMAPGIARVDIYATHWVVCQGGLDGRLCRPRREDVVRKPPEVPDRRQLYRVVAGDAGDVSLRRAGMRDVRRVNIVRQIVELNRSGSGRIVAQTAPRVRRHVDRP